MATPALATLVAIMKGRNGMRAAPAAKARRLKVETLLAVVIVVKEKTAELPPWHLRCLHCGEFALVRTGALARAPPACAQFFAMLC